MDNKKVVDVLNSLIQINNDRIDGYDHATKETDESDLKSLFQDLANTSRKCNDELIAKVDELGGTPTKGTLTSGKLYRVWMDFKAAVTKKDRKAILSSCEYGEDWAVKTYKNALEDKSSELPAELVKLIRDQFNRIKRGHDTVKSLRDAVTA